MLSMAVAALAASACPSPGATASHNSMKANPMRMSAAAAKRRATAA
jgi:hypothetical protein